MIQLRGCKIRKSETADNRGTWQRLGRKPPRAWHDKQTSTVVSYEVEGASTISCTMPDPATTKTTASYTASRPKWRGHDLETILSDRKNVVAPTLSLNPMSQASGVCRFDFAENVGTDGSPSLPLLQGKAGVQLYLLIYLAVIFQRSTLFYQDHQRPAKPSQMGSTWSNVEHLAGLLGSHAAIQHRDKGCPTGGFLRCNYDHSELRNFACAI